MLAKSTEYAIRALVFIQLRNWEEKRPGVLEIATEIEAPSAFSAKILQTLTRHNLVDSAKGRGGGFYFNEEQKQLTLYQVIHVMEGDGCFHRCGFGLKSCNNENPCPLHEQYKQVRDGFYDIVKNETIQSLSEKIRKGEAVLNRISS
ncbi:MAG TPA: Rrf2 family transcriptional regulator [Draconibacterium sp.]|nr:Rrf2 family transcriptional regulator [Draconibacterium sp.]